MSQSVTDHEPVDVVFEEAGGDRRRAVGTPEGRRLPVPLYDRLRELAPVHPSPSYGTLTGAGPV